MRGGRGGGQASYELPLKTIIPLSHHSFRAIVFPCRRHVLRTDGERQPDPPEFKTRRWHKANSQTLLLEAWKLTSLGCDGNRRGRAPCRVTFTQTSRTICLIPHCFNRCPETLFLSEKASRIHLHKKEREKKTLFLFPFPPGVDFLLVLPGPAEYIDSAVERVVATKPGM